MLLKFIQSQNTHNTNDSTTSSVVFMGQSQDRIQSSNKNDLIVYYSTIPYLDHYLIPKTVPKIPEISV